MPASPPGTRPLWTNPKILIGLALSGLLTWLAVRGTDPGEISAALARAEPAALLWSVGLTYLVLWLRSLRWRMLLAGVGPVSARHVFEASLIGYAINYLLPIRIGELVRAYLVGSRGGFSRSAALGTVVVERVLDVLSILVIFAGIGPFLELPTQHQETMAVLRWGAFLFALAGIGALFVILAFRRHTEWLAGVLERRFAGTVPFIARQAWRVTAFERGLHWRQGWLALIRLGLYTLLIWVLTVVQIMVLAQGMGLDIPWLAGCLVLVALAVGVSLPSAPGMVGTFHYATLVVLLIYAIPRSEALSYAILLHAVSMLPVVVVGLGLVWSGNLTLRKLLALEPKDA